MRAFNHFSPPYTWLIPNFSLVAKTLPQAMKLWSYKNFDLYHALTVKVFTQRKSHPRESLAKITVPVTLLFCGADVAYDKAYMDEFYSQLQDAGVKVNMVEIPDAPHFGAVTHPKE